MSISATCTFGLEASDNTAAINRFYKSCGDRSKVQAGDQVYSLRIDQVIVAVLRIQPRQPAYFLRSVCVAHSHRRQGLAKHLITQSIAALRPQQGYCFALAELQNLYTRSGFINADASAASSSVRDQYRRTAVSSDIVYMVTEHV